MKVNELKIYCTKLAEQVKFYSETMGLKMINRSKVSAMLQIGSSKLILTESDKFRPYHFAINIPGNKEKEALAWLKSRVQILKFEEEEIQDFESWNAKAIYFYDADKNIVELIARKNLDNATGEDFNSKAFLEISEIGLAVDSIKVVFTKLKSHLDIEIYDGSFARFCAIGDENGLFICINKELKDWFPTEDKAHSSDFELSFSQKEKEYKLEFKRGEVSFPGLD